MKKILTLFCLISSLTFCIGAETSLENYGTSFLLPIDWSTEVQLNLSVNIPKGFKSIQPTSIWDKIELIEFIPKKEDAFNWSEIITVQRHINKSISANQITALLIDNLSKLTNFTILFKESSNKKYQEDMLIAKYHHNGKDEILGFKYLSGPYDTAGIQYTIRLNEKQSQEEAIEKIKNFFKNNSSIIKNYKSISNLNDPDTIKLY